MQLNTLESSGLIQLAAAQPELEYLFRHALIQEAAYGSLLKQDRKQLHHNTGEALEQLYSGRLDEIASTLALHFEKAEQHEKAIRYFILAGDRARARYANREALDFYQSAIKLLSGIDPTDETQRAELAQCHEDAGELLAIGGQQEAAKEQLRQASSLLTADDNVGRTRLLRKTSAILINQSQGEAAHRVLAEAETLLGEPPIDDASAWQREWIQLQLEQCWMFYAFSKVAELERKLTRLQPALEQFGTPAQQFRYFYSLLLLTHRLHRYTSTDEDISYAETSLTAARQTGDLRNIAFAVWNLGVALLCRSDLPAAEKHLLEALQILEKVGDTATEVRCLTYLVVLYRRKNAVATMNQYLPRLLKSATGAQMKEYVAAGEANAAWQAWREGRISEAVATSQAAAETWQKSSLVYPFQWQGLWTLVAAFTQLDQMAEVVTYAQRLLSPQQQAMPDELCAELENGIRAWQEGQTDLARRHFTAAMNGASAQGYL